MNVYKGNKMKTILIILFLELGILVVQAEYNPNNSSSAKNLSEISDYLQKSQIPLTQMAVESQKKIIKEVAEQEIHTFTDLGFVIELEKNYFEDFDVFKHPTLFLNNLKIFNMLVNNRNLISTNPQMAEKRDEYTCFLLESYKKSEKLFREKYNKPLEIVNNPDFVPIPSGSTQTSFVSGISPDSISDPIYREQYRKVYDKHKKEVAEKCAYNDMHYFLLNSLPLFKDYIVNWIYSMYKENPADLEKIMAIYNRFPEFEKEQVVMSYYIRNQIKPVSYINADKIDKLYAELTANSDNKKILKSEKNVEATIEK